ncbi:ATP-binding protein [Phenylobacterium sp.]|uniref:ATP-binding protein n=1 Tax=Phenylobacterium sp. TaxID=1871053 RepID=UPI003BA8D41E
MIESLWEGTLAASGEGFVRHDPNTGRASPYQLTLLGLRFPVRLHLVFNAFAGACIASIGHPWLGAMGFVLASGVDWFQQHRLARWTLTCHVTDERIGFRQIAGLCGLRACVYLVAPMSMVLARPGLGEVAYLSAIASTLIALGLANGSFSRSVMMAFAAPSLLMSAVVAIIVLPIAQALGVIGALSVLGFTLALISTHTLRAIGEWHAAYNANAAMIPELEAARDQALRDRILAEEAREDARRANAAKSNFLATMSHEIRTPMNGVLGMAQLLRRDGRDPRQTERLDTLIQSGEYLLSILNDILDFSKIDAGRLEIEPVVEDFHAFMDHIVNFWGARADERGVALTLSLNEAVPRHVWVDALRLRQVLFNLVGNALKFTERGSVKILVAARPNTDDSAWIHVAVHDTGAGIATGALPKLFDRFSQADDTAERRFGGTGLGLSIAKRLTELMGGRIWAASELGVGSVFHIELPLGLADPGQELIGGEASVADEVDMPPLRILVVDDNSTNLLVLEQLLAAFGHETTRAQSGTEALAHLEAQVFDLVLMDIQMPGMTGIEALQKLRASNARNRLTPVVALTADVVSGGRDHYLGLGFSEHAAKPIQIPDLMRAIEAAIKTEAPEPKISVRQS